jgi:hypothetical protein
MSASTIRLPTHILTLHLSTHSPTFYTHSHSHTYVPPHFHLDAHPSSALLPVAQSQSGSALTPHALDRSSLKVQKRSGLRRLLHANGQDRNRIASGLCDWIRLAHYLLGKVLKGLRCQAVLGMWCVVVRMNVSMMRSTLCYELKTCTIIA